MHQPAASTPRLLAKILRELAAATRFESFADLNPAFRARLAHLRVRYTQAEFDDAINLVAASARLIETPPPAAIERRPPEPPPITRQQAADLLQQIRRRLMGAEMR